MIKLVVLDFDDTLCLTEEACFHLENTVAAGMGFAPMPRSAHRRNWGTMLEEAIQERIPGIDPKEFMRRITNLMNSNAVKGNQDPILEENLAVLDDLKKKGKKIAILTSRTFSEARHLLHESHPLSSKIEAFYHKDNSQYFKPDPRVFDQVLTHFNVSAREAVYVGDAISDAMAAKKAGLHFIAVLESGLRKKDDFKNYDVDFFAKRFTDILSYID